MTTDGMNWVERRALIRENISSQQQAVWEGVCSAVQSCCKSFNIHYPEIADAQFSSSPELSSIHVTAFYKTGIPGHRDKNEIIIEFDKDKHLVRVSKSDKGNMRVFKEFKIEADKANAFLMWAGEKVSPDRVSELTLDDVLFKGPLQSKVE